MAQRAAPILPNIVMGSSMGGYIATTLLPDFPIQALILICPALYAAAAYTVPFTESFSAILRRPGSYKDATALEDLRNFEGSLLFLIGQNDKVIPSEVMDIYLQSCPKAHYVQYSVIRDAPHKIHQWAAEAPENAATMRSEIDRFLAKAFD